MAYLDDNEDLFEEVPKPRRLLSMRESEPRRMSVRETLKRSNSYLVRQGVSVSWLMDVFDMPKAQVTKALRDCKPISKHQNGGLLYDLREAAAYLVKPKTDINVLIASLKADQLPERLRETFWNAKLKELKYGVQAGDLWPTERVLMVFGDTFQSFKNQTQLWIDTINETHGLTEAQRATLSHLVDQLQDDMHRRLLRQAAEKSTQSHLADLDDDV